MENWIYTVNQDKIYLVEEKEKLHLYSLTI